MKVGALCVLMLFLIASVESADDGGNGWGLRDILMWMRKQSATDHDEVLKEIAKLKADIQDLRKVKNDINDLMAQVEDLVTTTTSLKTDTGVIKDDIGSMNSKIDSLMNDRNLTKRLMGIGINSVQSMTTDMETMHQEMAVLGKSLEQVRRETCKAEDVNDGLGGVQKTLQEINMTVVKSSVCHREELIREYCGTTPPATTLIASTTRPATTRITSTTSTTSSPRSCTDGYAAVDPQHPGNCFKVFKVDMTFPQAEEFCKSHGANLARLESISENDRFVSYAQSNWGLATGHQCPWVGGQYTNGRWNWLGGSNIDYERFYTSGLGRANRCLCVCLDRGRNVMKYWHACTCSSSRRYFVCEK